MKDGGANGGHSEESKAKMSASQKGRKHSEETKAKIAAANMGHPVSQETKDAVSRANTGRIVSEEQKRKASIANSGENSYWYGKNHSEEAKEKISKANTGKKRTEEQKAAKKAKGYPSPNKGKKMSQEAKDKAAATRQATKERKIAEGLAAGLKLEDIMIGRPQSEAERAKRSQMMLGKNNPMSAKKRKSKQSR